ncbi:hypothetical protein [Rugosimonospora africana]|uniref:Uncharacterized protein n=1 Tax=Rugosimonospora africana TaxID=556532 RepID=A0A8J3QSH0_9ACTN|nr:hypothetical protein [Rugosimonospora africana]GIH15157.1 hypothetical protein Raf01_33290 [Rugosimonospora africana]
MYDRASDGASAVARWYTDYGRWGTCHNAHGYSTWAVCDKDFADLAAVAATLNLQRVRSQPGSAGQPNLR